jgi:predicted ATPase
MAEMVRDSTGESEHKCRQLAGLLWKTTAGNPFFTCQLLRDLHHNRVIVGFLPFFLLFLVPFDLEND